MQGLANGESYPCWSAAQANPNGHGLNLIAELEGAGKITDTIPKAPLTKKVTTIGLNVSKVIDMNNNNDNNNNK